MIITILAILLMLIGLSGIVGVWLQGDINNLMLLLPLGVLILVVAPYAIWVRERKKVAYYESQDIEFIVKANDQYIRQRGGNIIYHVGVKATGMKSISGVKVILKAYGGKENSYIDEPLHPGIFNINPSDIPQFVEVLSWSPETNEMGVQYNKNHQLEQRGELSTSPYRLNSKIPSTTERLTLYASGENMRPLERDFGIKVIIGKKPDFYIVDG